MTNIFPFLYRLCPPLVVHMVCMSLGYMVADSLLMVMFVPLRDWKMVLHHTAAIWGSLNVIGRPVGMRFGNTWFLMELSTPFVHMRLILHTLGYRRSLLYKVNGVAMLVVFFLCRITTILVFVDVIPHMKTGELYKVGSGVLINMFVLTPIFYVMNIFWFIKICKGAYRVLYSPKMNTE
ncbi:TMEM56 [Branchiostoma lanceolatum]|uniref:TMEM56 protein n=1 Tax=Branchiostoma lanceolatum TaxID=7740 RepID=A0A8J9YQU0_BRALA|nr:TMEM56 [Branchiostoma lanceolatum]